jgi:GntR family transcriptional repressor for pyruvate dehydrogenase complex
LNKKSKNLKENAKNDVLNQRLLNIKPVEKLVLIDQIIEIIGRLIAEGALKPGDALPSERDLSEMMKVSRTSVRQALKALDVLGVLEINPGSRTFLNKSISKLLINPLKFMTLLHDITTLELFGTRKIIEVELAKLAAVNATETDIKKMEDALEVAKGNLNDPKKYVLAEMEFHDDIFKASGNRILTAIMASINNLLLESREKSATLFSSLEDSLKQHLKIFEAIKKKDSQEAGNAMLEHLTNVERLISKNKIFDKVTV